MPPQDFLKPYLPHNDPASLLFRNANIVNPEEGKTRPNTTLHISNGVINSLTGSTSTLPASLPPETQTIDLAGSYIIPGLIDAHVHVSAVPGDMDLRLQLSTPRDTALYRMAYTCRAMLQRGFTTVRDCGGAPLALKDAVSEWLIPGPRLITCGHALSQTGGHGDLRDGHEACSGSHVNGLARVCDGAPECLRAARDEIRQGADFIKVMAGGGVASPSDKLEDLQYTPDEYRAFVAVARNAGTYVTCHAYIPAAIQIAVQNGVRGIEHGNLLDAETAKIMAEKGVYLTPTLVTYKAMSDPALGVLPPSSREKNTRVLEAGFASIKLASDAGVTMCYGSDLLGPLGRYQSEEFALRAEAGLSAVEVLRSATVNPAKMMGLEGVGLIREGYTADFVVLRSDPLADISVLARPEEEVMAVVKGGRVAFSRIEGLRGILDEVAKL